MYEEYIEALKKLVDPKAPPQYTFELFQKAQALVDGVDKAPATGVKIRDIRHLMEEVHRSVEGQGIVIHSLHTVARGKSLLIDWPDLEDNLLDIAPSPKDPRKECCQNLVDRMSFAEADFEHWKQSEFIGRVTNGLETRAANMNRVDTIIGFGLGALKYDEIPVEYVDKYAPNPRTSFLQHLTCLVIKDILEKIQGQEITVLTQDPSYCPLCIKILKDKGIEATTNPIQFFTDKKYLNEHTFVVTVHAGAPIKQVVFDLTADVGGPAGLLYAPLYQGNPEEGVDDQWIRSDPPSIRELEYLQQSAKNEMAWTVDDTQELAGFYDGRKYNWLAFVRAGLLLKKRVE